MTHTSPLAGRPSSLKKPQPPAWYGPTVIALGLTVSLLAIVAGFLLLTRHHPKPVPAVSHQVTQQVNQALVFTIIQGDSLNRHLDYHNSIVVARWFKLPIEMGEKHPVPISYPAAFALEHNLRRVQVSVRVVPGDYFNLNGQPTAWVFIPSPARHRSH